MTCAGSAVLWGEEPDSRLALESALHALRPTADVPADASDPRAAAVAVIGGSNDAEALARAVRALGRSRDPRDLPARGRLAERARSPPAPTAARLRRALLDVLRYYATPESTSLWLEVANAAGDRDEAEAARDEASWLVAPGR